jgi:hypothetical protein
MFPVILKLFLGVSLGAVGGLLYYKIVGCPTNTCPITKSPLRSAIYGALLGIMIAVS